MSEECLVLNTPDKLKHIGQGKAGSVFAPEERDVYRPLPTTPPAPSAKVFVVCGTVNMSLLRSEVIQIVHHIGIPSLVGLNDLLASMSTKLINDYDSHVNQYRTRH